MMLMATAIANTIVFAVQMKTLASIAALFLDLELFGKALGGKYFDNLFVPPEDR